MDRNDEPPRPADCNIGQPHITLADLKRGWIGIGAAIEWIVMRGEPLTVELYRKREDEAYEALVTTLADMPQNDAKLAVRGEDERNPGPLNSIPGGIWPQTATSDSNDSGKPYLLIGMDEYDEWGGALLGPQVSGYHRVQVRADFIREHWPEPGGKTAAPSGPHAFSPDGLKHLIGTICQETPVALAPLTQKEVIDLVKRCLPGAPRDIVRQVYRNLLPVQKRGPRGPRNPDRQRLIQELSENLVAAQLHN